jgi:hypothetical protein
LRHRLPFGLEVEDGVFELVESIADVPRHGHRGEKLRDGRGIEFQRAPESQKEQRGYVLADTVVIGERVVTLEVRTDPRTHVTSDRGRKCPDAGIVGA